MGRSENYEREKDYTRSIQDAIQNVFQGSTYPGFREDLNQYRQRLGQYGGQARPEESEARRIMLGMMSDPTQRGMSETELTGLKARQLSTIAGAKKSTMRDIERKTAASGLGSTGIGIRQAAEAGHEFSRQQRESTRDIEIANEELKRSDLFKAIQGTVDLQRQVDLRDLSVLGMEQQSYSQDLEAMAQLLKSYGLQGDLEGTKLQAMQLQYQPGFWKQLAFSFLNTLGQEAAKGISGQIFGKD